MRSTIRSNRKLFLVRSTFFLRILEYFLKRFLSKCSIERLCESFWGEYPGLYNEFGKTRSLHFLTERKENAIFHGRVTRTRKVKNRESREICRTPTRNIDFDIYRSESWDPRAYTRHIRSVNLWNLWGKKEEWKNRRIFFINCGNISCRWTTNH